MIVRGVEFNMFGEMTYVVIDPETLCCAIVDPGMMNVNEQQVLDRFIEENKLKVEAVIATHVHVDHVMGMAHLAEKYGVGLSASPDDEPLATRVREQVSQFHLPVAVDNVAIEHPLHDGDTIKIGSGELKVLAVPGHSQGSIALYDAKDGFVITGDALFNGSIGRTDLPGGDHATLVRSIRTKLFTLPSDTIVYPGHGPATTIGREERENPFL